MGCKQNPEFRGETLYLLDVFEEGNPYVLRDGTWFEVFRSISHTDYHQDDYVDYPNSRMRAVSQHEVPLWIELGL